MSERYDKAMSFLDECVDDVNPHDDTQLIAESVMRALKESVEGGWRTQEEADQLAYQWLGKYAIQETES